MSIENAIPIVAQRTNGTALVRAQSKFFLGMSIVLLLFVLSGFAPTLYLRAFFDVPPIPASIYLHGGILTGWFVWLVVQTSLVQTARTATHRRLGVVGVAWAARGRGGRIAGDVQRRPPRRSRRYRPKCGH